MRLLFSITVLPLLASVHAGKSHGTFKSQGETIAYDLYHPDTGQPIISRSIRGSSRSDSKSNNNNSTRLPIVVAGPGFPSVKELFFTPYGEALANNGIALMVFDYPGFGASTGLQRQDVVISQQHQTYVDALDVVAKDDRFDAGKIGVMGKSLSGAHAIHMASINPDNRIKAAVSIVPHIHANDQVVESRVQFLEDISKDVQARDAGGIAKGAKRTMVRVFGPPGTRAIMTTDGANGYLSPLLGISNYKNEATATSLLEIASYDVSSDAANIKIPILVATGKQDTVTPAQQVLSAFQDVKSAKVLELDGEHFTVTERRKATLVEQTIEWFQKYLQQS